MKRFILELEIYKLVITKMTKPNNQQGNNYIYRLANPFINWNLMNNSK